MKSWRNVKELFLQALERTPGERRAFLARAAGGDDRVVAEVESLLRAHDEAEGFIEGSPVVGQSGLLEAITGSWARGRKIGRYRVVRHLGRGALGSVFRAEADPDGTVVALELLSPEAAAAGAFERFRELRSTLTRLEHPRLARILDGGETHEGLPYLVMEYVEGLPIDRYADARRLDVDGRVALFLDACDAVAAAHDLDLVHLDLKPRNVIVTDLEEVVKVRDLGLTSLFGLESEAIALAAANLTTPYSSPEQVRGGPITPAADVYALAVLLFELVTGRHPLLGMTRPADLKGRILGGDPSSASEAAAAAPPEVAERRGVDPEGLAATVERFDALLRSALSSDPTRRPATAGALAEAVRALG